MDIPRLRGACLPVTTAVLALLAASVCVTPAIAASDTDTGSPEPTPSTPEPIEPPADSVFDETVGGELLGARGGPAVVSADAPDLPDVDAPRWLIADADSGDVLAARNPHVRRPPASTLKLLTALAAVPEFDSDASYVATDAAAGVEGSKVGLVPEQKYAAEHILHGAFLASGNDAAYALGELAGGQKRIVKLMNAEADRLGAFDTDAKSPHGLDTDGQRSSAYDLALIGRAALGNKQIADLAQTLTYDFPGLDGETYQIQNTNRLLGSYDGAIGLKNGYTTKAGHTIVAAAQRDGTTLMVTVMGADGRAEDVAAALFEWAFAAEDVAPIGELVTPSDVEKAAAEADDGESDGDADSTATASPDADDGAAAGGQARLAGKEALIGGGAVIVMLGLIVLRRKPASGGRYANRR